MTQTLIHKTPVPFEWIGLARQLRTRVGETADIAKLNIERLIGPLRPKGRFTPVARHVFLQHICDQWQTKYFPEFGRLSAYAQFENGKLRLAEMRAVPTRLRYSSWNDPEDWEQSISIRSTIVINKPSNKPPLFAYEQRDLAAFGLHAVARKWMRGSATHKNDDAILQDMREVAHHVIEQKAEFEIPVDNGFWVGEGILINSKPVLMVRTFR